MSRFLSRRRCAMLLLTAPALARAQDAARPRRGPNGGRVEIADGHPLELVLDGPAVTIFLTDNAGRPEPSRGATRRVVLQQGNETATVTLQPAAPNRLIGTLPSIAPAGARMVFSGIMADGHRLRARFVLD